MGDHTVTTTWWLTTTLFNILFAWIATTGPFGLFVVLLLFLQGQTGINNRKQDR